MIRIERLNDGLSRPLAAAGSPGHLRQQLKRPLRGAEIRKAQAHVRRHDTHQRHVGKVVALRNHLRTHEHVDVAILKPRQQRRQRPLPANRIAIHPRDAGLRKEPPHFGLDAFGAETGLLEIRRRAGRTGCRHSREERAVVQRALRAESVNHQHTP